MEKAQNFWYIIPAMLAESGKPQKALLYGLITSLTRGNGCCTASNFYLAEKLGKKDTSIIRTYLTELEKEGWIYLHNRKSRKRSICLAVGKNWGEIPQRVEKTTRQRVEKTTPSIISNSNNYILPFSKFWDLYDKKVCRPKCERKWELLPVKDKEAIMLYIPKYIKAQPDKKFRKNPETFLNNRSWEDELIPAKEVDKKAGLVKLHDGTYAKWYNGRWVSSTDNFVKIDLHYYPELAKR